MKRILVAIAFALCLALPASAQLYKWVDSNGKVQYSDQAPPSNIKTEKLNAPAPAVRAPAAGEAKGGVQKGAAKTGPKTPTEQEQAFRKRQTDAAKAQEEDEKKQAQTRENAENCRRAKAAVATLQIGGRQVRIDEKGERAYLSDEQIAQETAKAQQEAAAACK